MSAIHRWRGYVFVYWFHEIPRGPAIYSSRSTPDTFQTVFYIGSLHEQFHTAAIYTYPEPPQSRLGVRLTHLL